MVGTTFDEVWPAIVLSEEVGEAEDMVVSSLYGGSGIITGVR